MALPPEDEPEAAVGTSQCCSASGNELAFKKCLEAEVVRSTAIGHALALVSHLAIKGVWLWIEAEDLQECAWHRDPRILAPWLALLGAQCFCCAAFTAAWLRRGGCPLAADPELSSLATAALLCAAAPWLSGSASLPCPGRAEAESTWQLAVVAAVAWYCLCVPVRCCCLWGLPLLVWGSLGLRAGLEFEATRPAPVAAALRLLLLGSALACAGRGAALRERCAREECFARLSGLEQHQEVLALNTGLQALARSFCSTIVVLKDDFTILEADPATDNLLSGKAAGTLITGLMSTSDAQGLMEVLSRATYSRTPEHLSVTLARDGDPPMEVSIVAVGLGAAQAARYLLGLSSAALPPEPAAALTSSESASIKGREALPALLSPAASWCTMPGRPLPSNGKSWASETSSKTPLPPQATASPATSWNTLRVAPGPASEAASFVASHRLCAVPPASSAASFMASSATLARLADSMMSSFCSDGALQRIAQAASPQAPAPQAPAPEERRRGRRPQPRRVAPGPAQGEWAVAASLGVPDSPREPGTADFADVLPTAWTELSFAGSDRPRSWQTLGSLACSEDTEVHSGGRRASSSSRGARGPWGERGRAPAEAQTQTEQPERGDAAVNTLASWDDERLDFVCASCGRPPRAPGATALRGPPAPRRPSSSRRRTHTAPLSSREAPTSARGAPKAPSSASSAAPRPRDRPPAFDGAWVLSDDREGSVSGWLKALWIRGHEVVDALGTSSTLAVEESGTFLERGRLWLEGERLYRCGQSGTILSFSRVSAAAYPAGVATDAPGPEGARGSCRTATR